VNDPQPASNAPLHSAIDVHAHFLTPQLHEAMIRSGNEQPDGMPAVPQWDPQTALAMMDRTGISAAVLSVSSPGVLLSDDPADVRDLARAVNEEGAAIVHENPNRFGLFASLPLPDISSAIDEIRYALDDLGADGIALETHYRGIYLGAPEFDPVMDELNDRAAVVHIHPTSPACWPQTSLGRPRPMIEFLFDTTRALTSLALNGVLDRHPAIRFIVAHSGAALPVLADRIAAFAVTENPQQPVDVLGALRRLHYDVAGFALPRALPALLSLIHTDRLLYGSDYPFTPDWVVNGLAEALAGTDLLTDDDRLLLSRGNAASLFPRLA
jgi:predicted TIM-barrel fold metal-dependent hydrolase